MGRNKIIIPLIIIVVFIMGINIKSIGELVISPRSATNETLIRNNNSEKYASDTEKEIVIMEKHMNRKIDFYFGMTKNQVIEKLKSMNISDIETIKIEESKNNMKSKTEALKVNNSINIAFNKDETLCSISVYNGAKTQMGLKHGASKRDMEKVYGRHYTKGKYDNGDLCEYMINGYYFTVFFGENNALESWSVSLNSSIKR